MTRPTATEAIWAHIRSVPSFVQSDVARACDVKLGAVGSFVRRLLAAGIVERCGTTRRPPHRSHLVVYRVAQDVGEQAPSLTRDGDKVSRDLKREQCWRTLKMLREPVTPRQLAKRASTEACEVDSRYADYYLRHLARAGYCIADRQVGAHQPRKYRLRPDRNTGGLPPVIRRVPEVFDPNLGKVVWRDGEGVL